MTLNIRSSDAVAAILALSPAIRYAAVSINDERAMRQRDDLAGASGSESDKYEELLVNPALLTLARARGDIDCGGLSFLVVGYGNFQQLVLPIEGGHASVCFPHDSDPRDYVDAIVAACMGQTS